MVARHSCSAVDHLREEAVQKLAPEQGIDELFVGGRQNSNLHLRWDKKRPVSWRNFFLITDRMVHWFERVHIRPLRKMAIKRAKEWMLERFEKSDGLGAIYPAMLNSIVALRCLDYSLDDPQMIRAMDEFEKLGIDCPEGTPDYPVPTFRMQPCFPPYGTLHRQCMRSARPGFGATIQEC